MYTGVFIRKMKIHIQIYQRYWEYKIENFKKVIHTVSVLMEKTRQYVRTIWMVSAKRETLKKN